jgi:GNAT superfamily N-acetyltransferase
MNRSSAIAWPVRLLRAFRGWLRRSVGTADAQGACGQGADALRIRRFAAADPTQPLRALDAAYAAELRQRFADEPALAEGIDREGRLFGADGGLDRRYAGPAGAVIVAEHAEGLLGCVGLRALPGSDSEAEIRRLYVQPSWRGRGLARRLLRRAVAEAAALGFRCLLLSSADRQSSAHRLYLSQGFAQVSTHRFLPREVAPRFSTYALFLG